MSFTKNFRTPAQLTGTARGAFRAFVEQYTTDGLLPLAQNFTLDFQFNVGSAALPPAASFRSFNTESMVGQVGQGAVQSGKLPPISIRLHVDEYQQLKMYGQNDAIGAKFDEYAVNLAQAIGARIVLAQAEAVAAGKVTIAERGLNFEVDFGRAAGLTASPAGAAWSSTSTAVPLTDLEALRAVFDKSVDRIILSRQAMTYLQSNVDLIKIALQRGSDLPSRISQEDVRAVIRDYGFGEIEINEQKVTNASGVQVPLFAADKVVFISGDEVGRTDLGVTAESIEHENGISTAPGLFAGAMSQSDPSGYNVLVSAIALPVVTSTNNTAVLDAY